MKKSTLALLAVICLVAVLGSLWVVERETGSGQIAAGEPLLPGLEGMMNDVEAIDIVALDGSPVATLRRERGRWRMREKSDYEADFERIHRLLRDLSRARREAPKTANPEWYGRLGVEPVGQGDADRAAVRFPASELPGLIIGDSDPVGVGRYVRIEGEPQSWLTGERLELPTERLEWLEQAIMDIPAEDIRELDIRHPNGDVVALRPGDAEGSVWVLLDAPPDREVREAWRLRQRANALAKLNLVDVRPHQATRIPDDAIEAVYRTRDGLAFTARLFVGEGGKRWVHFRVRSVDAQAAGPAAAATDAVQMAPEASGVESESEATRSIDAVAIDGRLSPWQFAIDEERFERLTSTVDDLLVPEADPVAAPPG